MVHEACQACQACAGRRSSSKPKGVAGAAGGVCRAARSAVGPGASDAAALARRSGPLALALAPRGVRMPGGRGGRGVRRLGRAAGPRRAGLRGDPAARRDARTVGPWTVGRRAQSAGRRALGRDGGSSSFSLSMCCECRPGRVVDAMAKDDEDTRQAARA